MGLFDQIVQMGAVVSSAVKAEALEITLQVLGLDGLDGGEGESAPRQPAYSQLGLLFRPLPPTVKNGETLFADVVCLKTYDGLLPIAWRDKRINAAFPNGVKEGTIAVAGYGGGFYSLDLTAANSGSQKANIHVIYCPYQFSGGIPGKAHAIMLDPTSGNESISITHGAGYQLSFTSTGFTVSVDGSTFMSMTPGKFFVQAASIQLKGNVGVGQQPEAGMPLLPAMATQPGPSLFISPV